MPYAHQRYKLSLDSLHLFYEVDSSGCWNWNRSTRGRGYGQATHPDTKRQDYAHRVIWQLVYGDIPKDLVVKHMCDNRLCVNPKHLELGTYSDNNQDTWNRHPEKEHRREQKRCLMVEDRNGDYQRGRAIGMPIGLAAMNGGNK